MATLALKPTATTQAVQEDPNEVKKTAKLCADPSDIDSGWVVLGKSDIVPVELVAAAAGARRHLGFLPMPMIPIWAQWVLEGVVYTAIPFYKRVRMAEGEAIENAETVVEVVEHAAEATEKVAANVADSLPEDGSLQKAAEEVEYIAEEVDKDAHKVEAVIKKIEEVSNEIDTAVEPVIEELQKNFKLNPAPTGGSNAQK